MRDTFSLRCAILLKDSIQRRMTNRSLDSKPRVIVPSNTEDSVQSAGSFSFTWINKQTFPLLHLNLRFFFVLFCSPIGLLLEETIRSFLSQLSPNNYYWTIPGESLGSRTGESWSKLIKDEQRNNLDGLPPMRDWTGHQKRFVANRTIWRARPGGAVVHRLHFQPAHMSWLHQNSGCEWCSTPAQRQENRTGED